MKEEQSSSLKTKILKLGFCKKKILVLNENGENILRKGPYIVDLESVGWTGKYAIRYEELYRLVYYLDWPKK